MECWCKSEGIRSQLPSEMNLPGNLHKTAGGIEVLPNGVLGHCFNDGIGQALGAEIVQRMFDELAAKPATAELLGDCQIGNTSLARVPVETGSDVADHASLAFGDKNAGWVRRDVFIDMAGFAPTPIMPTERAQGGLKILLDCDTAEGFDGEPFDALQIVRAVQTERNAIHEITKSWRAVREHAK